MIIGGGDTGADCYGTALRQGAASVTQLDIHSEPPPTRDPSTPWPTYPLLLRTSAAHEEGGERVFGVNSTSLEGTTARSAAIHLIEGKRIPGGFVPTRRAPTPGSRPTWCCWRWASSGPETTGLVDELGVEVTGRGTIVRDDVLHDERAGRVRGRGRRPGPVADRLGDRRGPLRRRRRRRLPGRQHGTARPCWSRRPSPWPERRGSAVARCATSRLEGSRLCWWVHAGDDRREPLSRA